MPGMTIICSLENQMARRFDYLADVEVFLAVAERGSFTAGAVALSSTPSVLSLKRVWGASCCAAPPVGSA